jgi:hypothetical protein
MRNDQLGKVPTFHDQHASAGFVDQTVYQGLFKRMGIKPTQRPVT